jgi:hypothetical protein
MWSGRCVVIAIKKFDKQKCEQEPDQVCKTKTMQGGIRTWGRSFQFLAHIHIQIVKLLLVIVWKIKTIDNLRLLYVKDIFYVKDIVFLMQYYISSKLVWELALFFFFVQVRIAA